MKLKKEVKFRKPFHKIHEDPTKNYGVGSLMCWMTLSGEKGAVQFCFSTGTYLPETHEYWKRKGLHTDSVNDAMGFDVGYHSPDPMFDGHTISQEKCEHLGGKPCYYDGSGLKAEEWMEIFLREGDDAIWSRLEEYYKQTFKN